MPQDLRIGIVGTSWWADAIHLPSLTSHPSAKLVSICGRTRNRAEEMARKYNIPEIYTDYRELIERSKLDALVVVTPDDLHYPIVMDALEAGLHIVCEKPLALTVKQALAMCEKAEAKRVKHMVFFTWRWMPHFRYLHDLVESGFVGQCFECQLRFFGGAGRDGQYNWRADRQRANGVLGDLGSHWIDFARWYVGDIRKVSAHLTTFVDRVDPNGQPLDSSNDAALLAVEFVNGAQGMIQVSGVAHVGERFAEQRVHLYGAAGTLEVDASLGTGEAEIRGIRSNEEQFQILAVPENYWGTIDRTNVISDVFLKQAAGGRLFVEAILEDRPIAPNFYDGLKVQQVIEAAIESDQKGMWVSVP